MKYIFKLTLALTLLFSTGWVYGQTTTIDYTLESETVTISNMEVTILSTINKVGNTIEWKQEANDNISSTDFQINSVSGDWDLSTSTGVLTHVIVIEDYQGLFVLEGTASGLTASLTLTKDGTEQQQYTFTINSITYL